MNINVNVRQGFAATAIVRLHVMSLRPDTLADRGHAMVREKAQDWLRSFTGVRHEVRESSENVTWGSVTFSSGLDNRSDTQVWWDLNQPDAVEF